MEIFFFRISFLNHTQADIIAKKNETLWTPETGFSKSASPFDTPWRVTGDTIDNSVRIIFNLKSQNAVSDCPKTDSGLTVIIFL